MSWVAFSLAPVAVGAAIWGARSHYLRHVARQRLYAQDIKEAAEHVEQRSEAELCPALRRQRWIAPLFGAACGASLHLAFGLAPLYCVAFAALATVLALIVEGILHARRSLELETQLANSIDLMVSGLVAGAAVPEAVETAARESRAPLQGELEQVLARLRGGDRPSLVFEDLAKRVPLENFRLFAFSMAVQSEAGGSLATTLASVGRSIRDRIEIGRKVRSQTTQAQASVVGICAITYGLALLMWLQNEADFEAFAASDVGTLFASMAILLQAAGLQWITRLSQLRF